MLRALKAGLRGEKGPRCYGSPANLEIEKRSWFISAGLTYFFVFVVTLVVGAMVTLIVSERRKRSPSEARKRELRPFTKARRGGKGRRKK